MHELLAVLLEVGCYGVVRILLPVISFGCLRVEKLDSRESDFNWAGLKRSRDGRYLLRSRNAALLGCCLWLAGLVGYFWFVRVTGKA